MLSSAIGPRQSKQHGPSEPQSPNIQIARVILYNSFVSSKYYFLISILAELPKKDQVDIVLHSTKESFF
jgi:hypothetical protein